MARISTYQLDTVIHDDDNVIGTNVGGSGETVLFPVGALTTHIRSSLTEYTRLTIVDNYEYDVTGRDPENDILWGGDIELDENGQPAFDATTIDYLGTIDTTTFPFVQTRQPTYPILTITHDFRETMQPVVLVFRTQNGVTSLYTPEGIDIIDGTTIEVDLGPIDRYEGYIAIFT